VDAAFDLSLEAGFEFEAAQEQSLFEDGEAAEGITAFVEKRTPRFA
jgi:enoyl-CoA hydratase